MRNLRVAARLTCGVLLVLLTGCGGSGALPGGPATLRVDLTGAPDSLDPALAVSQSGVLLMWSAYTPLLTYAHREGRAGTRLIPGLARALPTVSADGKTYRLQLRRGLRYCDGTPVRASDFEHALQRVLSMASPGAPYFLGIRGAARFRAAQDPPRHISGITADDRTGRIVIRLIRADATFANRLATTFASLVPGDTPRRNLTTRPPPGTGAYRIARVTPGRSITLVANPRMPTIAQDPRPRTPRVQISVIPNQDVQVERVLRGQTDLLLDPPTPQGLALVRRRAPGRVRTFPTLSTYYVFLNAHIKPFDDVRVRRAVAAAIDRRAIERLYGGLLAPGCGFLPPGISGHLGRCADGTTTGRPDVGAARQLVAAARAGGTSVTVRGDDTASGRAVTGYLADVMRRIGLHARAQTLAGAVFLQTIGNRSADSQAGATNWFPDYPHPADYMIPVDVRSIADTGNLNPGEIRDPVIDRLILRAEPMRSAAESAPLYEAVERRLIDRADVIPFGSRRLTKLVSARVAIGSLEASPVYGVDLSSANVVTP